MRFNDITASCLNNLNDFNCLEQLTNLSDKWVEKMPIKKGLSLFT